MKEYGRHGLWRIVTSVYDPNKREEGRRLTNSVTVYLCLLNELVQRGSLWCNQAEQSEINCDTDGHMDGRLEAQSDDTDVGWDHLALDLLRDAGNLASQFCERRLVGLAPRAGGRDKVVDFRIDSRLKAPKAGS